MIALTVAGSDSGGGAGIQADLKTFSALGVYGASVVTAVTAQNTLGVRAVEAVTPAMVDEQLDAVLSDLDVAAIKVGMLADPAVIDVVADRLGAVRVPVVVDPVMIAASGQRLIAPEAVAALWRRLFPLATIVTPNLPEAAALLGVAEAQGEAAMAEQAAALGAPGPAVLLKGGHMKGAQSVDLLWTPTGVERLAAPRVQTANTHGTGCTLSSAIAARLALGDDLHAAVRAAKQYVSAAIGEADRLSVGHGHGPVHHFFAWWGRTA